MVDGVGFAGVAVSHRAREAHLCIGCIGDRVHLQLVHQLQTVLDLAEVAVRVGERGRVVLVDVSAGCHLAERDQRVGAAQRGVEPAVHELQQLDRELDVTDPASAPLHLAILEALAHHLLLDAGFHRPHRTQVVGGEDVPPEVRRRCLVEPGLQLGITGDGSRLDERLELPRVGPLIPVGLVRRERAHERAVSALRAEVHVDSEAAPRDLEEGTRPLRCSVPVTVSDEHHVDVAGVVQLVSSELPHPDDDERLGRVDERRRALQDVTTECCDRLDRDLELVVIHEIARGDAQVLAGLPSLERIGVRRVERRPRFEISEDVERSERRLRGAS